MANGEKKKMKLETLTLRRRRAKRVSQNLDPLNSCVLTLESTFPFVFQLRNYKGFFFSNEQF